MQHASERWDDFVLPLKKKIVMQMLIENASLTEYSADTKHET